MADGGPAPSEFSDVSKLQLTRTHLGVSVRRYSDRRAWVAGGVNAAFQREYKAKSDHNGLKGYSGMYFVKVITERIGKVDGKAFAAAMKGAKISVKDNPGVLMDVTFDQNGDLDRESFLSKVVDGKQVIVETLPALGAK